MAKMIVLLKKKEGMEFEAFRDHYENVHVPLVGAQIGHLFRDFRRYYPKHLNNLYVGRPDADQGKDGGTHYDAIAIYTIDDANLEEVARLAQEPDFVRRMTEDEERFCDRSVTLEGGAEEFFGPGING